jgi:putative redox protein
MQYKLKEPVHGEIHSEKYQCTIVWLNGQIIADETTTSGGKDSGPDPYTLLLSALVSCSLITMRMYADRKGWDIPELVVNANLYHELKENKLITYIDREILFPGTVSEEQQVRLLVIAKQCPVAKILENEVKIHTY